MVWDKYSIVLYVAVVSGRLFRRIDAEELLAFGFWSPIMRSKLAVVRALSL
jgi:hypothetical protein